MDVDYGQHVDKVVRSTLFGGEVVSGRLYSTEAFCSFQPHGLSVIENTEVKNDEKYFSCTILVNDVVKDVTTVEESDGGKGSAFLKPVEPSASQSLIGANQRERESIKRFQSEKNRIGVAVTQSAQKLFNSFHKQLPLDTKWANPGKSQDIIVLGVLIKYPYSSSSCFVVSENDGQKSLQRISVMVKNFLNLPPDNN